MRKKKKKKEKKRETKNERDNDGRYSKKERKQIKNGWKEKKETIE